MAEMTEISIDTHNRAAAETPGIDARIDTIDWQPVAADLDGQGWGVLPRFLPPGECREIAGLYEGGGSFRSKVVMARHGFGRGEYQYFAYPLPRLIDGLRGALYRHLAPIANRWNAAMAIDVRYPAEHAVFLERCHAAGQTRPTPLLLQYGPGDYNCLHQDLYGEHAFPLQVAILLSEPGEEFEGGEFVLTEQRPRMQSRPSVVPLRRGDAVVFAVNQRPVEGSRGVYRTMLRHGVSRIRAGRRYTVGIIFHDAT
ncbi:MAG: proline hydroxylase [Rhodospirillales bacterium]|nr:proline hydroxylase [Rhodospirillales bacterium]